MALDVVTGRIRECFFKLMQLGFLNLFEKKMDGPIPGSVGELPNLSWLGLWGNFDSELPQNLGQSGNLQVLDVTNCKISSPIPRQL